MLRGSRTESRLAQARIAVLAYFLLLGAAMGVWLVRIPSIKHRLSLTDGLLGLALLAIPLGTLLMLLIAGRIVDRYGSARVTHPAGVAAAVLILPPGLVYNLPMLIIALFALGVAGGLCDIAMNAQGVEVERAYGRPLMASFHASYSLGGLLGAAFGGLFAQLGMGPGGTFAVAAIPLAALGLGAGRRLLPLSDAQAPASGRHAGPPYGGFSPLIVILGVLALFGQVGEGAAGDWSGVYLRDNLGTSEGFAALGYTAFSVTMTVGRLLGDRLALQLGPVRLVRICGLLAGLGLAAGLLSRSPVGGVAGLALLGAGLSCMIPQIFSAAGNADPTRAGRNIARVAGLAYIGLLGGPVLIGGAASLVGLPWALGVPVVLALAIAASAGALRR